MQPPSEQQITLDPERALLHVVDVAAAMTVAILHIFNDVDGVFVPKDRERTCIHRIVCRARDLRLAIADYHEVLDDPADHEHGDYPF